MVQPRKNRATEQELNGMEMEPTYGMVEPRMNRLNGAATQIWYGAVTLIWNGAAKNE